MKIRPTTSSDIKGYSFICACGALWSSFDLYHALQWIHLHKITDSLDTQVFQESLNILHYYGADLPKVSISVIILRIVLRICFWAGSCIVLALYSFKIDRVSDGYRLVGFLLFVTISLNVIATFLVTGQAHLFIVSLFGSVSATLGTLGYLLVIAFLLFPRRKGKKNEDRPN